MSTVGVAEQIKDMAIDDLGTEPPQRNLFPILGNDPVDSGVQCLGRTDHKCFAPIAGSVGAGSALTLKVERPGAVDTRPRSCASSFL